MTTILNLKPISSLTREKFYQLCQSNPELQLERNAQGELIIVSPVGGESGKREADLLGDLLFWNRQTQLGVVFSSSTIFSLPNGGDRSPDVAWVSLQRWEQLTQAEKDGFPPLCPDFVIELRSKTDRIKLLQEKMQEYLNSGLKLGWLINPQQRQVEIYRPQKTIEVIKMPCILSGETILPDFNLSVNYE